MQLLNKFEYFQILLRIWSLLNLTIIRMSIHILSQFSGRFFFGKLLSGRSSAQTSFQGTHTERSSTDRIFSRPGSSRQDPGRSHSFGAKQLVFLPLFGVRASFFLLLLFFVQLRGVFPKTTRKSCCCRWQKAIPKRVRDAWEIEHVQDITVSEFLDDTGEAEEKKS